MAIVGTFPEKWLEVVDSISLVGDMTDSVVYLGIDQKAEREMT